MAACEMHGRCAARNGRCGLARSVLPGWASMPSSPLWTGGRSGSHRAATSGHRRPSYRPASDGEARGGRGQARRRGGSGAPDLEAARALASMATPDPGSKPSPTSTGSVSGSTVERVQALDVACSSSPRPADVDEPMGEVEEQSRSRKACSDGSDGPSTDTDDPHSEVRPPKRARQRIINGHGTSPSSIRTRRSPTLHPERETSTHRRAQPPPS